MAKPDLKLIDETYEGPDQKRENVAGLIKEGRRRANADLAPTIHAATLNALQPIKQAHKEELDRIARTIGKAQHREGLLHGIILGMLAAIGLAFATWIVLREVVITNVNVARTPQASVPILQNEHTGDQDYERVNPREPPSAQ